MRHHNLNIKLSKPEEVYGYIYGLKSPSGKWYIGQTTQINVFSYIKYEYKTLKGGGRPKIALAIDKYGYESFDIHILDICPDDISLNELESIYIEYYDSIVNGYNCLSGGLNSKHTDISKEKIRQSHLGKKPSKETLEKLSKAKLKYKYTLRSPTGDFVTTNNLFKFCKENKLNNGAISVFLKNNGWQLISKEALNASV